MYINYISVKKHEILIHAIAWMNLEDIMLNKRQTQNPKELLPLQGNFQTKQGYVVFLSFDTGWLAAAAAKSLQSCPTLCDPIDGSPPGSPVPEILQARTLEWVAIAFSSTWKWKVKMKSLSRVWLLATPWTAAYQPPPSIGFSRPEYRSRLPLPSPLRLEAILFFFLICIDILQFYFF